jgi:hypothetical protein
MNAGRMVCRFLVCLSKGPLIKLVFFVAKLAISIARKMNALIFLVPEDIVDIRARLVCVIPSPLLTILIFVGV